MFFQALTGGNDHKMNKQTLTYSSPLTTADEAHDSPMLHDPSPPPITDQRVHVHRETPLSVKPSRHPKSTTSIQSEIEQLEAQCEHLNLELRKAKAKLEKEQSDLTKALVVELQALPIRHIESHIGSGCVEDTLVRVAAEFRSRGWTESTKRLYRFQLKCYLSFCETLSIQPVPVSTGDFSLYIAYLAHYKFRFCKIENYLAVVKYLHKANDINDPITDNWYIKHVLLGVKRDIGDTQVETTAVTTNMLLMIKKELNLCRLYDLLVWVACLIGFFGLLRPVNFLFKDKHTPILRIEEIDRIEEIGSIEVGFVTTCHKTKTIQFREKQLDVVIPQITGHLLLCENVIQSLSYVNFISFVNDILSNAGCGDKLTGHSFRRGGATFAFQAGLPEECIQDIGMWKSCGDKLTGHSFRRGGATFAFQAGLAEECIQDIGMWKRNAYLRYIEKGLSSKSQALQKFEEAMPL
ncbi:unnamed protein product [Mytilus coruscus]|uniref:Tyr recombinase domain-containing protein n=1 Tax=Mytilus coruscus TaxID=42192 RepID=A0A6J8DG96_MYTCO|nr:unnamed protein product [Mytilus coruscus]